MNIMASSRFLLYALGAFCISSSNAISVVVVDGAMVESENPDDVKFLLFNDKLNPNNYDELKYDNMSTITASKYNSTLPTKFLVHGFANDVTSIFPQNVKNAYLSSNLNYNIIVVDWGKLAKPKVELVLYPVFYAFVVKNVQIAGTRAGEFIAWLNKSSRMDLNKVHIVGHSLGAHVAGNAGATVQELTNLSVDRLTGLDPAGPLYMTGVYAPKLSATDGAFVDAYHTNCGELGNWDTLAQVDGYINGGVSQPGCAERDIPSKIAGTVAESAGICSHTWATWFFAQTIGNGSIRPQDLEICASKTLTSSTLSPCEQHVTVGEYMPTTTTHGTYFFKYNYTSPAL